VARFATFAHPSGEVAHDQTVDGRLPRGRAARAAGVVAALEPGARQGVAALAGAADGDRGLHVVELPADAPTLGDGATVDTLHAGQIAGWRFLAFVELLGEAQDAGAAAGDRFDPDRW
jgi:hypothetical protein